MARKTHATGYRLGEATWWKTRTPPATEREGKIEKIIQGVMERFGFITSEVMVQKGNQKGIITMVGTRMEGQEGQGEKASTMEVYLIEYLQELIKKTSQGEYKVSYREGERVERNAHMVYREMALSNQLVMTTMRQIGMRKEWK